jgi:Tol biopolymer transport system component
LQARYVLGSDSGPVSAVTWSTGSNRIAYLRSDPGTTTLRVRSLVGSAATTTIASGDIGAPAWFPDSTHLVFTAAVAAPAPVHKAFVVSVVTPPASLNPSLGLPTDPGVDVALPAPSPDGHQIAFLSAGRVWLMNADGTRPDALTGAAPLAFPYSCRTPAWTSA